MYKSIMIPVSVAEYTLLPMKNGMAAHSGPYISSPVIAP